MKKFLIFVLVFMLAISTVAFAEKKVKDDKIMLLEEGDITYTSEMMDDGTGRYEVTVTIVKHGQLTNLSIKKVSSDLEDKKHVVVNYMGEYDEIYEFPNPDNNEPRDNRDDEILTTDEDGNYVVTFKLNNYFDNFKVLVNMTAGKSHVNFREVFSDNLFPKVIE